MNITSLLSKFRFAWSSGTDHGILLLQDKESETEQHVALFNQTISEADPGIVMGLLDLTTGVITFSNSVTYTFQGTLADLRASLTVQQVDALSADVSGAWSTPGIPRFFSPDGPAYEVAGIGQVEVLDFSETNMTLGTAKVPRLLSAEGTWTIQEGSFSTEKDFELDPFLFNLSLIHI